MALVYSIVGGPDAAKFNIDATTGDLTFKTPPDFENPGSAAGTNDYRVTVGATDPAAAMTTQDRVITVTDVNEAPPNQPPVFTSPANVSVPENQTAVDAVQATDPDASTPPPQPSGFPDATNTGVRAGVTLVGNGTGVINSTGPNTIISGRYVDTIVVDHANVRVVDCDVNYIDFHSNGGGSSAEFCRIKGHGGGNSTIDVLGADDVHVSRCNISGFGNGVWLEASGFQFRDNYLHAPWSADPNEHFDGIQVPNGTNARNCVVAGNNFALGGFSTPPVSGMSSCMTLSDVHGMVIDGNRIDGGTYCIYFEDGSSGCNLMNNDFVSHHDWGSGPTDAGNWINGQSSNNGHTLTNNTFGGVNYPTGRP